MFRALAPALGFGNAINHLSGSTAVAITDVSSNNNAFNTANGGISGGSQPAKSFNAPKIGQFLHTSSRTGSQIGVHATQVSDLTVASSDTSLIN